jgi:type IV secretion system protein VirB1
VDAMTITGAALAALLQTCAPSVAPSTMSAIVRVESGGNPLAIGDISTGRSYAPRTYADALSTAKTLIARGHSVDVGLAQINSGNFASYHTNAAQVLFPCQGLIIGSAILANAYRWSSVTFADPRRALCGAVSSYNTGSLFDGAAYVKKVVAQADRTPFVPSIDLLRSAPVIAATPASIVSSPKPKKKPQPHAFAIVQRNATSLAVILKETQ